MAHLFVEEVDRSLPCRIISANRHTRLDALRHKVSDTHIEHSTGKRLCRFIPGTMPWAQ